MKGTASRGAGDAAEARFGVQIADDELTAANCSSVPRLAKLVASKLASA